ncbi:MAG: gliding motility-associated C-terminal domain-containing protein [Bacteroidales bacterium]|nr:gliding motility-associated C-terminal domain-containing protein [Bacteroidales bacterium]
MKEQEIGKLFKEKLAGYQTPPPEGVWNGIQHDAALKKFNRSRAFHRVVTRIILPIIGVVAVVSTILIIAFNNKDNIDSQLVVKENTSLSQTIETKPEATLPPPVSSPTTATPAVKIPAESNNGVREFILPATSTPLKTNMITSDLVASDPAELASTPLTTKPASTTSPVSNQTQATNVKISEKPDIAYNQQINNPSNDTRTEETPPTLPKSDKTGMLHYSKDTSVCRNSPLNLYVENAASVHWSIGSNDPVITIYPEENTQIYANVQTMDKVDTTIYVTINVFDCELFVPTAFTPNGDGLNDEFLVHAPMEISNFEMLIFDKMSRSLFQTKEINYGWDGTSQGKPLPPGTYFYVITFRDALNEKHVMKGQLVLIR